MNQIKKHKSLREKDFLKKIKKFIPNDKQSNIHNTIIYDKLGVPQKNSTLNYCNITTDLSFFKYMLNKNNVKIENIDTLNGSIGNYFSIYFHIPTLFNLKGIKTKSLECLTIKKPKFVLCSGVKDDNVYINFQEIISESSDICIIFRYNQIFIFIDKINFKRIFLSSKTLEYIKTGIIYSIYIIIHNILNFISLDLIQLNDLIERLLTITPLFGYEQKKWITKWSLYYKKVSNYYFLSRLSIESAFDSFGNTTIPDDNKYEMHTNIFNQKKNKSNICGCNDNQYCINDKNFHLYNFTNWRGCWKGCFQPNRNDSLSMPNFCYTNKKCNVGIKSNVFSDSKWIVCNPEQYPTKLFNFQQEYINKKLKLLYKNIVEKKISLLNENSNRLTEYIRNLENLRITEVNTLLTIIATIFLPLTFISGWYGMNFSNMPLIDNKHGYKYVIIIVFIVIIFSIFIFRSTIFSRKNKKILTKVNTVTKSKYTIL